MEFKLFTRDIKGNKLVETFYDKDVRSFEEAEMWGRTTVDFFNSGLKSIEYPRIFIKTELVDEEFYFFYKGEFSQWYMATIRDGDLKFCCNEQYMMYHKAMLFKDTKIAKKIMKETDPYKIKMLGRTVYPFSEAKWNKYARPIVYKGNLLKFSQHIHLNKLLKKTMNKTIVEASPTDKIYGIGRASTDARALNRKTWNGSNWLGYDIVKVRLNLFGA